MGLNGRYKTMISNRIIIKATDDFHLPCTLYRPKGAADRVVLINSATGIPQKYYNSYANFLREEGFIVITFDYRGIGESRPENLKGFSATMHEWAQRDIKGVIDWISKELKPTKIFFVGHSAGGQLFGLASNNNLIDGMITVAAPSGYWGHWPFFQRYLFAFLWFVLMPLLTHTLGYFPSKKLRFGENLPKGVALEWALWCRNPDYLFGYGEVLDLSHYESYRAPILAYSFDDDSYAPKRAVDALLEGYTNAKVKRKHIVPEDIGVSSIGHFGFFREQFRDSLWRETSEWLKQL